MKLSLKQIQDLQAAAVEEVLAGKDRNEIIRQMVAQGMDERTAGRIVNNAVAQTQRAGSLNGRTVDPLTESRRGLQRNDIIFGATLLIFGVGATVYSYMAAKSGGIYVFPYGAILVGALLIIRGVRGRSADDKDVIDL